MLMKPLDALRINNDTDKRRFYHNHVINYMGIFKIYNSIYLRWKVRTKIIKILILIGLIILLIQLLVHPLDNCDTCELKQYNNTFRDVNSFINKYEEKCFSTLNLPISFEGNVSLA